MNSSSITIVLCMYLLLFGSVRLTHKAAFASEVESWRVFHPVFVPRVASAIPLVEMAIAILGVFGVAVGPLRMGSLTALVVLFIGLVGGQLIVILHTRVWSGAYDPGEVPPRLAEPIARTVALGLLAALAFLSEL